MTHTDPNLSNSPRYRVMSAGTVYDVELGSDGNWRAWHGGRLFAMSGEREHLEHVLAGELEPTPRARRTDPETSHAAASHAGRRAALCRAQVRELLEAHGGDGLTLDQIVRRHAILAEAGEVARFSDSGIRTRVAELVDAGEVVDTGERRRMPSGRSARVWALAAPSAPLAA